MEAAKWISALLSENNTLFFVPGLSAWDYAKRQSQNIVHLVLLEPEKYRAYQTKQKKNFLSLEVRA